MDLEELKNFRPHEASVVLDREGGELGRFYIENRTYIAIEDMPTVLYQAFIAVEDQRFFQHRGVDVWRILPALIVNLGERRTAQGFSTITMQLARNLFPEMLPRLQKTLDRKLLEIRVAREIEKSLSKMEILEIYLNTIYLGAGAYGVHAAAETYFGKPLEDLTLEENALLGGLPKAPSRYNPYENLELAKKRRNVVLSVMRSHGLISGRQFREASAAEIRLAHPSREEALGSTSQRAAYFIEVVRKELLGRFGEDLYRKGLRIHTTLDPRLQVAAETAITNQILRLEAGEFGEWDKPSGPLEGIQGAALVLDLESGDVLAMVGGRDFKTSRFNRATQAKRQPGSAFKPFIYAAAVEQGYFPTDLVSDAPIEVETPTGELWAPENFSDAEVEEDSSFVPIFKALEGSYNRATVRLFQEVGAGAVVMQARRAGLEERLPLLPSLALGAAELRLSDLVAAYGAFGRDDGRAIRPRLILRVESRSGETLWEPPPSVRDGLNPTVAYVTREMLRRVVDQGTGYPVRAAGYTSPAAGKTGTSNGPNDVWFVGVTERQVAGVWLGFDLPQAILPGRMGTGGRLAAPVWAEIMKAAPTGWPPQHWSPPPGAPPANVLFAFSEPGPEPEPTETSPDTVRLCIRKPRPGESPDTTTSFLMPCDLLAEEERQPSPVRR